MFVKSGRPEDATDAEIHWLAGLLEGEGSFFAGSPSAPNLPVLQVSMVDEDVIARVAALFAVTPSVVRPRRANWRTSYTARVRGSRAVAWMHVLRPHLGARRRAQVDGAIASYECRSRRLLDDDAAREALLLLKNGLAVREVAESFSTSVWCIYDLRLGRTHRHLARD